MKNTTKKKLKKTAILASMILGALTLNNCKVDVNYTNGENNGNGGNNAHQDQQNRNIELDKIKFTGTDVFCSQEGMQTVTFLKDENGIYSKMKLVTDTVHAGETFFGNIQEDGSYIFDELDGTVLYPNWLGVDLGLSYSDFGKFSTEGQDDLHLYGGYDDKRISNDITGSVDKKITFKGNSVGEVCNEDEDNDTVDFLPLRGTVELTLEKGKSTLKIDHDNWYDIEIVDTIGENATHTMSFKNGDVITNDRFKFNNKNDFYVDRSNSEYTEAGFRKRSYKENGVEYGSASDVRYYGNNGNPSEAIGQASYGEQIHRDFDRRVEIVFGAKLKENFGR